MPQAADAATRTLFRAENCRYGAGFLDPALERLLSLSIYVGQQAHLAITSAGKHVIASDYSAADDCGDGKAKPVVIIPALYQLR